MIRSWIAILVLFTTLPAWVMAEELPAPKVRAADVPAAPAPVQPALPLPDIDEPTKPTDKPADKPAVPPAPAPLPGPSIFPQANPNPSGTTPSPVTPSTVTPSSPAEKSSAAQTAPESSVPEDLKWRYKWHNGQWWYWSPATETNSERWMIWDKNSWIVYDPATYRAPAGFAKPGPRIVTRNSITVPLPENYSGAEVSTPQSYYLTPGPTYVSPTPYAFGTSSYYGPNGPAASYYNRRGVSISIGVPAYGRYWAAPYIAPRYTAPIGAYYGGRGVTIGFGF